MRIFSLTFHVTKTCQNGNEKSFNTNVYVSVDPYDDWDYTISKAVDYLKKVKHYYCAEYVSAKEIEVVQ